MATPLPDTTPTQFYITPNINPFLLPPEQHFVQRSWIRDTERRAAIKAQEGKIVIAISHLRAGRFGELCTVLKSLNPELDRALDQVSTQETAPFAARFALSLTPSEVKNKCLRVALSKLIGVQADDLSQQCIAAIKDPQMQADCSQWFE